MISGSQHWEHGRLMNRELALETQKTGETKKVSTKNMKVNEASESQHWKHEVSTGNPKDERSDSPH